MVETHDTARAVVDSFETPVDVGIAPTTRTCEGNDRRRTASCRTARTSAHVVPTDAIAYYFETSVVGGMNTDHVGGSVAKPTCTRAAEGEAAAKRETPITDG